MNTHSSPSKPPETWAPVQRAAAALASPIQRILAIEAASGVILLVASIAALLWANLDGASYADLWHLPLGFRIGSLNVEHSLHFWVNDGAMTIFFLVVGLEIRREIFEGELATLRSATLPLAAAIGGMLVPAVVFVALNNGRAGSAGWAVPMATDIAFAVGVLTLLGSRVPSSLRMLLLALAVIDDIGAIIVIAVFYSSGLSLVGAGISLLGIVLALVMRAAAIRSVVLYLVPGTILWGGLLAMGIHPTLAGVILGMLTPVRPWFGASGFAETTQAHLDALPTDRAELLHSLDEIGQARREAVSPVERLIHVLHPWVAFVVMPIFALANAGVVLGGASFEGDGLWLAMGIIGGLVLGKPIGIAMCALVATKAKLTTPPADVRPGGIVLVGIVGGIGFTMSLFIAQLAFPPGELLNTAKLAILIGSAVAIVAGLVTGLLLPKRA